ncbi:hypothetical protein B6U83_04825 [Thermoplasmatales archaeon ex4484_36]|nr:MAG: hypothetical protein B6U83_04825 [Thermoplasmatales archaeon ex4484_36]
MKLRVLALTGMPASGKGAIAEHLKRLGYPVVAMGDVVRYHYMREVGVGEVIGAADLRLDNSGHLDRALKDLFSSESVKKLLEVKESEAFHRS